MSYAEHWREHVLPRVTVHARYQAISVACGVPPITYSTALDETLRFALSWGGHRLSDTVWWDLETYVAGVIAATIEQIEAHSAG